MALPVDLLQLYLGSVLHCIVGSTFSLLTWSDPGLLCGGQQPSNVGAVLFIILLVPEEEMEKKFVRKTDIGVVEQFYNNRIFISLVTL